MLRRFYGGMNGALPPTDPRILALTAQQIDLEFELMRVDKARKEGNKEVFEDDTFDDYDKETEEVDSRLSDPVLPDEVPQTLPKTTTEYTENEWEEVE